MANSYDMRRITRVFLDWPATLTSSENVALPVVIRNLSMNGAYVLTLEQFVEGADFTLLAEYLESPIAARGVVNRVDPDGMALQFKGIEKNGFDNLVELLSEYADDPDVIRLEILEAWKLAVDIYD